MIQTDKKMRGKETLKRKERGEEKYIELTEKQKETDEHGLRSTVERRGKKYVKNDERTKGIKEYR